MAKHAISITIDHANLTWLKARVGAGGARSVSDLLDQLVTEARTGGAAVGIRSVVGTIDIDPADPLLTDADDAVAALFAQSLRRPTVVKEPAVRYVGQRTRKGARRG